MTREVELTDGQLATLRWLHRRGKASEDATAGHYANLWALERMGLVMQREDVMATLREQVRRPGRAGRMAKVFEATPAGENYLRRHPEGR